MVMGAFITGSIGMGGAVLMTVSDNQVVLAQNGVVAKSISRDIQEIRLEMSDFDTRIDANTNDIEVLKYRADNHVVKPQ